MSNEPLKPSIKISLQSLGGYRKIEMAYTDTCIDDMGVKLIHGTPMHSVHVRIIMVGIEAVL